jgi:hypothetical protein
VLIDAVAQSVSVAEDANFWYTGGVCPVAVRMMGSSPIWFWHDYAVRVLCNPKNFVSTGMRSSNMMSKSVGPFNN